MPAQLSDQHGRQGNNAVPAGLGFFLAAALLGLLDAGNDAKLSRFKIYRPPTQRRDLTPTQATEDAEQDWDENAIRAGRLNQLSRGVGVEHLHLLALDLRRLNEIGRVTGKHLPL